MHLVAPKILQLHLENNKEPALLSNILAMMNKQSEFD